MAIKLISIDIEFITPAVSLSPLHFAVLITASADMGENTIIAKTCLISNE